jgi:hypothetical protein
MSTALCNAYFKGLILPKEIAPVQFKGKRRLMDSFRRTYRMTVLGFGRQADSSHTVTTNRTHIWNTWSLMVIVDPEQSRISCIQ